MKKLPVNCALLLLSGLSYIPFTYARPDNPDRGPLIDSIGIEKKDGKRFILHRVDEGQTLYAISRRYGRPVSEIKAANPDMKESLQYHQVVRVPIPDGALSKKAEKAIDKAIRKQEKDEQREAQDQNKESKKNDDPGKAGIHVVEAGQTLYSLASRYGVSQNDLRKWNNLSGNNVLIGQAVIVSEKAYQARVPSGSMSTIAAKTADTAAQRPTSHQTETRPAPESHPSANNEPKPERRPDNDVATKPHPETETPTRATAPTAAPAPANTKPADAEPEVEMPKPGNDAPMPTYGRRISDSGVAEMIEGADGSGKYLALHRTAPIGTLVQVRNEFNNQSLWVKVIGRLPNTGINDKILIKLSTQAFSKLSPEDRRFRAEVSYIVK